MSLKLCCICKLIYWQRGPAASWAALGRALLGSQRRWLFPFPQHWWDFSGSAVPSSGLPTAGRTWTCWSECRKGPWGWIRGASVLWLPRKVLNLPSLKKLQTQLSKVPSTLPWLIQLWAGLGLSDLRRCFQTGNIWGGLLVSCQRFSWNLTVQES